MSWQFNDTFSNNTLSVLLTQLTTAFRVIKTNSNYLFLCSREFVDTTAGSQVFYLPKTQDQVKDFFYTKIDNSVNTVTIYPATGHTIMGLSSLVLTTQYDRTRLTFVKATQDWVPVST